MSPEVFHQPVLLDPSLELLVSDPAGTYLDGTLGDGGHSAALAARLTGRVIGIDRDPAAVARARDRLRGRNNFSARVGDYRTFFAELTEPVAGVLLDLGVSSRQLDDPGRGFSHRQDGPLEMRFGPDGGPDAAALLAETALPELTRIFREYGESRFAGALARRIVARRGIHPLTRTAELRALVEELVRGPDRPAELSRVFQALRIAVNGELAGLAPALAGWLGKLSPGGRLVVISYHSLEDRIVKRFFAARARGCICPMGLAACGCGRRPELTLITPRAVTPSRQERATNPRARSAKLRAAAKSRTT